MFSGWRFGICLALIVGAICGTMRGADPIDFTVQETGGLRRYGYPVTASLEVPQSILADAGQVRLVNEASQEEGAQFTAISKWPDGTVKGLDVDFMSSLGPMETESYRIEFGKPPAPLHERGLSVAENGEEVVVTSSNMVHKLRRDGKPLMTSITFRGTEYLAADGLTTTVTGGSVEIVKRGPLNVTLRIGDLQLEYVSSKSWVKITQRVQAETQLQVHSQFALTNPPVLWDLGVQSWLYGYLAKSIDEVQLEQRDSDWRVWTGEVDKPASIYATGQYFEGWGHVADKQHVIAFAIPESGETAKPVISLRGNGQLEITARRKKLTVFFHFVPQPVQVTAATSPPSMLSPLVVTVMKK